MATALQTLRPIVKCCQHRPPPQRYLTRLIGRRRAFTTAQPFLEDLNKSKDRPSGQQEDGSASFRGEDLAAAETTQATSGDEADLADNVLATSYNQLSQSLHELRESGVEKEYSAKVMETLSQNGLIRNEAARRKKKLKNTFLNMGEQTPFEDDDFNMESDLLEDMTSLAHGELERHREFRHYARLAAWEMPLLSKFAKPFEPPTRLQPLRFRYTSYLGEQHPAEKKIVVEFCTQDIPDLTMLQRSKLIKLAGVRYNPETDTVKMSCEMFPSQAQNKRYLGDLISDMVREAKDPKDTFEDVPFDMRHHKFSNKPTFPKSWKMTKERKEELATIRANAELRDQRRLLKGQLVDGIKQIEEAFSKVVAQPAAAPAMVMAGKGAGGMGKGKKVAVRR